MNPQKKIEDMSLEEIKTEILDFETNKFKDDENYIFVTYSHKDIEIVHRKVLDWIRKGYNIYIDVDFENQSSGKSWVDIMSSHIRDNSCVMAVCFRSVNYYFSYASLIELLTMRSRRTLLGRQYGKEPKIPIEIINIGESFSNDILNRKDIKEIYKTHFENLKKSCGKVFLGNQEKERQLLMEGLAALCSPTVFNENGINEFSDEGLSLKKAEEKMEVLQSNYGNYKNFYPCIAGFMGEFFRKNDLTGNTKTLDMQGVLTQFQDHQVFIFEDEEESPEPVLQVQEKTIEKSNPISVTELTEKPVDDLQPSVNGTIYLHDDNILEQRGNKEFVLLKGASVAKLTAGSCPGKAQKMREESLGAGEWKDAGRVYELLTDKTFTSLSGAAGYVTGNSTSGNVYWQKKDGKANPEEKGDESKKPQNAELSQPSKAAGIRPEMTLKEFAAALLDTQVCLKLRSIRAEGKAMFNKQMFDYVMAAALRGCDEKAEPDSARWKYSKYVVARDLDLESKELGASQFTWQSNSRKAVNIEKAGKLGKNSDYFAKLPETMTLGELKKKFEEASEEAFSTKDNEAVSRVFQALFKNA